jgi:hypothetical protein
MQILRGFRFCPLRAHGLTAGYIGHGDLFRKSPEHFAKQNATSQDAWASNNPVFRIVTSPLRVPCGNLFPVMIAVNRLYAILCVYPGENAQAD